MNVTLLNTISVPPTALPGTVDLAFVASAWTATDVDVTYSIVDEPGVVFANGTSEQQSYGNAVAASATTVKTTVQLIRTAQPLPLVFDVEGDVVDHGEPQFHVTWTVQVKS